MTEIVVFTGTLTTQTRKQASSDAEAHGFKVGSSLTKTTTYLICGEKAGKKMDDAKKWGVQVLTEDEWMAKLSAAQVAESKQEETKKKQVQNAKKASTTDVVSSQPELVVFTGTLTKQSRKEATAEAEAHGFKVSNSITSATTILVCGDKVGAKKIEDAKKKGTITVYSEDEWAKRLASSAPNTAVTSPVQAPKANAKSMQQEPEEEVNDVVVFTGTLVRLSRKEATAEAEAHGYVVSSSVTKATTILVCGEMAGKKMEDAKKKNILVLTEDEWAARLASTNTKKRKATELNKSLSPSKKPKQESESAAEVLDLAYDEATGAINGICPKTLIPDGQFHEVQSKSSSSTYLIKRLGSVYSCNCPAWRNQRHSPWARTCKHLKEVLGDAYELVRAKASATAPRSSQTTGSSAKASSTTAPKVLLANKWDRERHNPVHWWISEKLDGVRAYWDATKRVFLSRNGNVFPAPDWFTKDFPSDLDLDGELFGGRGRFNFTVGIAKTDGAKQWDQLVYKVFDAPSLTNTPFEDRMAEVQAVINKIGSRYMEWVEHTLCASLEHLDQEFVAIEKLGGEGLMLRQPKSLYQNGRSNSLLKIKSFHDGEARIIAYEDGKGKYTGMVGALRCQMASGKMFKVASGLSDADRAKPPVIGTLITYKCQELTPDGIPRFPIYVGVPVDKTEPKDPIIANAMNQDDA